MIEHFSPLFSAATFLACSESVCSFRFSISLQPYQSRTLNLNSRLKLQAKHKSGCEWPFKTSARAMLFDLCRLQKPALRIPGAHILNLGEPVQADSTLSSIFGCWPSLDWKRAWLSNVGQLPPGWVESSRTEPSATSIRALSLLLLYRSHLAYNDDNNNQHHVDTSLPTSDQQQNKIMTLWTPSKGHSKWWRNTRAAIIIMIMKAPSRPAQLKQLSLSSSLPFRRNFYSTTASHHLWSAEATRGYNRVRVAPLRDPSSGTGESPHKGILISLFPLSSRPQTKRGRSSR